MATVPTITFDKPFYLRGDTVRMIVEYPPLSIPITATAPNGEQATATAVFKVALGSDVAMTLVRVSDDGHTAVFTAVL
jgi:hypothetical protein